VRRPRIRSLFAFLLVLLVASVSAPLFVPVTVGPPVEHRGVSRGAAWGDYDGDGDPDLLVTRPTYEGPEQTNALYRNDGSGGFVRVSSAVDSLPPGGWEGPAWVDVDDDGDLDLHLVGREGAGSVLFENQGGGTLLRLDPDPFGGVVRSASMACWADADGDGLLDAFVVSSGDGVRNALFRNRGGWRFERVSLPARGAGQGRARACVWVDLDGDRLPELVIANARRPNVLLRNRGGMRLEADTTTALQRDTAYGYGTSSADVNGDGRPDVLVANFDAGNALYLATEDGGLERVPLGESLQSPASKGHAWGDYDLDGRLDLYLGSGTPRPGMVNRLYLGRGRTRFVPAPEGAHPSHADTSAAVAAADHDLDGDLDLFVANWGSPGSVDRLYRNEGASGGWLKLRLRGEPSNRMGVGARASVLTTTDSGPRWQHRWLVSSTGYAGQNEPVLHFGLGSSRGVDSLVVAWPSGTVDRFGSLPADVELTLREGAREVTR